MTERLLNAATLFFLILRLAFGQTEEVGCVACIAGSCSVILSLE